MGADTAVLRFDNGDKATRALKHLQGKNILGHSLLVEYNTRCLRNRGRSRSKSKSPGRANVHNDAANRAAAAALAAAAVYNKPVASVKGERQQQQQHFVPPQIRWDHETGARPRVVPAASSVGVKL